MSICCAISAPAVAADHYKTGAALDAINATPNPVLGQKFVSGKPVAFGITPPIRDSVAAPPEERNFKEAEERVENERVKYPIRGLGADAGNGLFTDPLLNLRNSFAPLAMPTPTLTFLGQTAAEACPCLPPDTNGDVGPNHYVQTTNVRASIYNKAGTRLLGANLQSSTFFSGLPAGNACRNGDDGDPVVLYDPLADRWMISQFEVDDVPGHQCIAISQTPDPTGAYFAYDFVMPNTDFFDYPHYGVWPNGYYLTVNQFNQAGTAFLGAGIFAFDREKMLAGDPTASYIYHDVLADDPNAGGMLPTDIDGFIPPPAGLPNRVMEFRADEFGDPLDAIRTYELVPNFVTPASSTFTIRTDLPLAAFDARAPNSRNIIEQPAGGTALDGIADRLMFRLAYRNLGTVAVPVNSWVGNFTVNVSGVNPTNAATYQSGVRWFELRSADTTSLPTVRDQGTQNTAPANGATGINNWMGGIAQDNQGSIALGFSSSSTTQNANIVIAGRTGGATGGGLNEGEATFFAATGVQSSSSGRWGDYSAMSVDPVDECAFWYTQEYYATTSSGGWSTRIGRFIYPGCTAPPKGFISATITSCSNGNPIPGVTVSVPGGFFRTTNATGNLPSSIGLSPGTYTATASRAGLSTATASLVVTNGATTPFSVCLVGQPVIQSQNATVTAESFLPVNNAVDPGELVTVNLCALNVGFADTVSLVGTLAASGNVTSPGAAQNFGIVIAGGAAVCRPFTFVANPGMACGASVVASVAFADGATPFGTKTYTLTTGTVLGTTTNTVSYTGPAVAIPDNVPAGVNVTLPVSGVLGAITDLNFRFDAATGGTCNATVLNPDAAMDHTFIGDLVFKLTSPGGTTVTVVNARGGTRENICTTLLDDEGGFPLLSTVSSTSGQFLSGNFTPDAALSGFDGQAASGNWVLNVADTAGVDVGSMRRFSLLFTNENRVCSTPATGAVPTVSSVSTQNILEDASTAALNVTVGDVETPPASLVLTAASNNTALVPNANIVLGGTGAVRTVQVTPAANASGTATITLTVTDGASQTGTSTFDVVVGPVNDAPSFTTLGNRSHLLGATGVQTVASFVSTVNLGPSEGTQTVLGYTVTEMSDPASIVSAAAIAANGTLTYTLSGAATGTATIRAILQDSGGVASGGVDMSVPVDFTITVLPINLFNDGFE